MARPTKKGIDYFPFDVDFFDDEKIAAISGEFGLKGELTAIKLLCAVYRNGYFILWSDMLKMKILRSLPGVKAELLDQIVNRLVRWGFFDEDLFNSVKVLTSRGIQQRYFAITKRRTTEEEEKYLLIEKVPKMSKNGVIAYKNPEQTELLHAKTPQSKVNESKVNEIDKSISIDALTHQEERDIFSIFYFKNFYRPLAEVQNYVDKYQPLGWVNGTNQPIKDKVAFARKWKQMDAPRDPQTDMVKTLTSSDMLNKWRKFYDACKAKGLSSEQLEVTLHIVPQSTDEGVRLCYDSDDTYKAFSGLCIENNLQVDFKAAFGDVKVEHKHLKII